MQPSGQCLTALPPEELGKKKTNRGPIKFRKRENWGLIEVKNEEEQSSEKGMVTYDWRHVLTLIEQLLLLLCFPKIAAQTVPV